MFAQNGFPCRRPTMVFLPPANEYRRFKRSGGIA
jgi:hypothetical protein